MRIPETNIRNCDFKLWYFIIVISSFPRLRIVCYSYRTYSYSQYFSQQMHLIKHISWHISNPYALVPKRRSFIHVMNCVLFYAFVGRYMFPSLWFSWQVKNIETSSGCFVLTTFGPCSCSWFCAVSSVVSHKTCNILNFQFCHPLIYLLRSFQHICVTSRSSCVMK